MKKFAIIIIFLITAAWLYASAQTRNGLVLINTQDAIDYLYTNWLTKFSTVQTFMPQNSLRRDEAAAFFARFARDVLGLTPDTNKSECNNFTDLYNGHQDLVGEMIAACQLWLMKWSNWRFLPTLKFSNAHAVTVIIRLLDGNQTETWPHRASNYLDRARTIWLTNWLMLDRIGIASDRKNLDKDITRGDVAKLIEAWSIQGLGLKNIDYTQQWEWATIEEILTNIIQGTTNNNTNEVVKTCTPQSDPYITIISPKWWESFKPGDQATIEWESCNLPESAEVWIGLSSNQPLIGWDRWVLIVNTINDWREIITLPTHLWTNMGYVSSWPHYQINVWSAYTSEIHAWNVGAYAVYSPSFSIYMPFCDWSNLSATWIPLSTQDQTLRENNNLNLWYINITNNDNCPKQITDIKSSISSVSSTNQDSLKKIHDNLSFLYYLDNAFQIGYRNEGPEWQVPSWRPQRQVIIMPNSTIRLDLFIFRHTSTIENWSSIRISPVLIDVKDKDGNIYSIQTNWEDGIQPILTTE